MLVGQRPRHAGRYRAPRDDPLERRARYLAAAWGLCLGVTTLQHAPTPSVAPGGTLTRVLLVAAAVATGCGAVLSGLAAGEGSRAAVVLPLAAGTGLILAAVALTRFAAFVMIMLVLRASMDLAKLSGPSAGAATVSTASERALDPASLLAVLFMVAAALWLLAQYRSRGALPGSSLRRALAVFAVAGLISVIGSGRPLVSAVEGLRFLAVVLMFAVLEQLMRDRAAMRRFLLAAYASTLFPLLYTAAGLLGGNPAAEDVGGFQRLTGPFIQSNTFARYLMLMLVFGVALYPHLERRLRVPMAGILAFSSVCLLLTYTLAAFVGVVVGLVVVGALQSRRVLAGLAVVGVASLLLVPQLVDRFGTAAKPGTAASTNGNSLAWRLDYWAEVIPLANANPVNGIGLNGTQYLTVDAEPPHNDVVRAYVETGLLGLGAYLALLWTLVSTGRAALRVAPPGSLDRGVAVGFLGVVAAFLATSLASNVITEVVGLWYLVTFAAAASAVARRRTAPVEPTP